MLTFDNRFIRELPGDPDTRNISRQVRGACWTPVVPTAVKAPHLLAHSAEVWAAVGFGSEHLQDPDVVAALAGNSLLPGMASYSTCYGGHQFGHWAGQLGDGRAIYLGEAIGVDGQRYELQLKGAGRTPYSRHADGRAVLRSSLREFLCSEAMHHLGVPTTRALSLVTTGEGVMRDMFYDGNPRSEPGAIVCRVAPSFTRFGHFEIFSSRDEIPLLKQIADFTLSRDFPEITGEPLERYAQWFHEVCRRTAVLMAHWMRVGFVHGVMNTDNMSILGLTIDYGPYGWIDDFDPMWTPNTTDAEGRRYCFGRQPEIARWNLERLAIALRPLFESDQPLADGLALFDATYGTEVTAMLAAKLGLAAWRDDANARDGELVDDLFEVMTHAEIDMTDFFRRLASLDLAADTAAQMATLRASSYSESRWQTHSPALANWLPRYHLRVDADGTAPAARAARVQRMNAANPRYVLRNYLAQQAIDRAEPGDAGGIHELLAVLRNPYTEQPDAQRFAEKRPDWARQKAGCSMLSCSS
jgi:uncharacterized protein YdiU (UPF0061 family)